MIRARLRAPRISMVGDAAGAIAAGEAVGMRTEGDALRFAGSLACSTGPESGAPTSRRSMPPGPGDR